MKSVNDVAPLDFTKSAAAWERARRVFPGGVHNNAYAFPFSPNAFFFQRAEGKYLYDVDGNPHLDLSSGHSALPLGNNIAEINAAAIAEIHEGTFYSGMGENIVALAEALTERLPSVEQLVFTDSGTKATNLAVRLARAFTARPKFAKFVGGFHGSWDGVLYGMPWRYGADPNAAPLPGVSAFARDEVVLLPFNDLAATEQILRDNGADIGSLLLEPVQGDGFLPPVPGFLQALRALCDDLGIVLIFDEMITFTLGPAGAQGLYGVTPDLTALGKVIGGGMGIGAVGGRADIMAMADPAPNRLAVPTGTTFGGHPVAMAAGLSQLSLLTGEVFDHLHHLGDRARTGVAAIAADTGTAISATGVGHLMNLHWNTAGSVVTYDDHCRCDHQKVGALDQYLRLRGFTFGKGVRCHFSFPMTDDDVDSFLETVRAAVDELERAQR